MTSIKHICQEIFNEDLADPRTSNWPLIGGSWKIPLLLLAYVVTVVYVLPSYMKYRKPYSLKTVLRVYNIYQVVACSFIIHGVLTSGWLTEYSLGCQPVDYSNNEMAVRMTRYMWWHLMVRIGDLLETGFFVLRKKYNQVSLLHIYHHGVVVFVAWLLCKYVPGGMASFSVPVNCAVHILMYSYYFLASLGPEAQQRLTIVKSNLTKIQILQLTVFIIHSSQAFSPNCRLKPPLQSIYAIYVPTIAIMVVLFAQFYVRSYILNKTAPQIKEQ